VQQRHSLAAQQRNRASRSNATAHYERWTDEDLEYLRSNLHLDAKVQAHQLGRTIASVQSARKRFGLKPHG